MGSSPVSRDFPHAGVNPEEDTEEPGEVSSEHGSTEALIPANPGHEDVNRSQESLAAAFESLGPGHDGVVDSAGKHQPGFQVPNHALDRRSGELKLKHPLGGEFLKGGKGLKNQKAVAAGSTLPTDLQLDPKFPGSIPLRDKPGLLDRFRPAERLATEPKDTQEWNAAQQVAARVAAPVIRTALEPVRIAKRILKSKPEMAPSSPVDVDFAKRNAAIRRRQQELSRLQEPDQKLSRLQESDSGSLGSESEPDEPGPSGGPRVTSV